MDSVTKNLMPIVSEAFCSCEQTVLLVRKRPRNVNGGGLVFINAHDQQVMFNVDGCGMLGVKGEVIVRDADESSILIIRKQGSLVQALTVSNYWKGQLMANGAPAKMVFSLREPKMNLFVKSTVKISIQPEGGNKDWDFEIGVEESAPGPAPASKDLYQVMVQPGFDQAFVVGVIASPRLHKWGIHEVLSKLINKEDRVGCMDMDIDCHLIFLLCHFLVRKKLKL